MVFAHLKRQLDEACAEFDRTGDATVQWRITSLTRRSRKTMAPRTLADRLTKLALPVDMWSDRSREEDWVLLEQVGKYFEGG